ncbi:TLC domain-containing protein 4-B-like isoform X2 [Acipenser ruthenus]|uniref:TLC domain-containing protein 4-B-like isoform X2 n=1 Tax=Acipenser ruthenus TaxID=7906 RepID=UPI00145B1996|nr:TLC domain-containing protein 4-B-like isoform X2 [Acipenser ruthenus]
MDELLVVAGSFVVFQLMFVLASPLLTALFCQGYGNVVPAKHTEWNSRGEPRLVKLNVAITCGYLVYDLLLLARYWKTMGDGFFVCHHIAALYAYGFVLSRGVLPYFANFRLLSELSTPFVNQRWFFEALSVPRSDRRVVLNGIAMSVVFFAVRIAVIPTYYWRVISTLGTPAFERLGPGPQVAWILSSVSLDVLNAIWMYRIARGCYRVVTGSGRKAKSLIPITDTNNHAD